MLHPPEQAVQQLYDSEEEPTPRASVLGTVKRMFGRSACVGCLPACAAHWPGALQLLITLLMLAGAVYTASLILPPSSCLPFCLPLPLSALQLATQTSRRQPPLHASCTKHLGKAGLPCPSAAWHVCPRLECTFAVHISSLCANCNAVLHLQVSSNLPCFALPSAARRGPLPLPAPQTSLRL